MKIELLRPINYRDEELHSLELDFESLTGYDILAVDSEMRALGMATLAWEYSREFVLRIAAKAANVSAEVLKGLSLNDFSYVMNEATTFLTVRGYRGSGAQSSGE